MLIFCSIIKTDYFFFSEIQKESRFKQESAESRWRRWGGSSQLHRWGSRTSRDVSALHEQFLLFEFWSDLTKRESKWRWSHSSFQPNIMNNETLTSSCGKFIVWMEYSITRSLRIWNIISYFNWPFFYIHYSTWIWKLKLVMQLHHVMKNIFFVCNIKCFSLCVI